MPIAFCAKMRTALTAEGARYEWSSQRVVQVAREAEGGRRVSISQSPKRLSLVLPVKAERGEYPGFKRRIGGETIDRR